MITLPKVTLVKMSDIQTVEINGEKIKKREFVFAWMERDYERSVVATAWGEKCEIYAAYLNKEVAATIYCKAYENHGYLYNKISLYCIDEWHDDAPVSPNVQTEEAAAKAKAKDGLPW